MKRRVDAMTVYDTITDRELNEVMQIMPLPLLLAKNLNKVNTRKFPVGSEKNLLMSTEPF